MSKGQTIQAHAIVRYFRPWFRHLRDYLVALDKGRVVFRALIGGTVLLLAGMAYSLSSDYLRMTWQQQRHADLACLARNVYHEARGEPFNGQLAVVEVTLNRRASSRFPATICGVVYEKRYDARRNRLVGAFSWTEFDELERPSGRAWRSARKAAEIVYDRQRDPLVSGALFYHATRIEPAWAAEKKRVAQIGNHIFYE